MILSCEISSTFMFFIKKGLIFDINMFLSFCRGEKNTEGMVIGVIVAIVILCCLLALGITCHYRKRSEKKKTVNDIAKAMLNTEDHIPLRNTNVKPNLSQIHIISEHELIQVKFWNDLD